MKKKSFIRFALCSLLGATAMQAVAAVFPDRPIKLVLPFPGGGLTGVIAHAVATKMAANLGQPVVIDSKPGASGTIAATAVAKAPKDGYTLLFGTSATQGIAKYMYKDLGYDPSTDFSPVALLGNVTVGVFAGQKSGITSLNDLLVMAKAKPGHINFGSPGVGSVSHLAAELFKLRAKVDIAHVPYAGTSPQMIDLVGGQTQLVFNGVGSGMSYTVDGRVKLIALAAKSRSKAHPSVPALSEVIPGYEAPAWLGIVAPKGTPQNVLDRLEVAVQAALADSEVKTLFEAQGIDLEPMNARAFGEKMRREMPLWEEAVRFSGAQPAASR